MLTNPYFWTSLSFIGFFALLFYKGVDKKILSLLDEKSENIRASLMQAQRLHDEAAIALSGEQAKFKQVQTHIKESLIQITAQAAFEQQKALDDMKIQSERKLRIAFDQAECEKIEIANLIKSRAIDMALNVARLSVLSMDNKQLQELAMKNLH